MLFDPHLDEIRRASLEQARRVSAELAARESRRVRLTLFDTRYDGSLDQGGYGYATERETYGEEMFCFSERAADGQRFITLVGPEGSIELHESCWREIARAMDILGGGE